ncbi:BTAD domain-containing putative transcriptional regulator [Streptomyces marincola]|uniref:BTAD domain-containing putative transcriptional regulator n=1 Tax=Streptomyces marincola TaxID=2878388 RepID=UPI001CF489FD|nr:BTAD domain-containing putative transcriptional regulator [Streptomyces marincola]UCM87581.1 winged helix-turn-helix domain-containing protein [Streptomyces marincola]
MRFGVLGPLAVWGADGELLAVREAKVRALLADLLVDPGRVVPVDRLIDDLWGEDLPANPMGAVQTRVSRLRRTLAGAGGRDLITYRAPGYLLQAPADAVDAGRFTALTLRARKAADPGQRAALLAQALDLWRGPAFADFADEEFPRAAIARLEEQRLVALEEHAEARLELGEHGPLAAELGELTARHPLRERLRAAHMRALYRAGRASEALDSFHDLRSRLREELGIDPGPDVTALHQEILVQSPALHATTGGRSAPPQTNLPSPVTDLIGRSGAVSEIRDHLHASRLVTLTGPGGVGKTRLAVESATQLADAFPDGCWLVELAGQGHSPRPDLACTADDLAAVVAGTLGVRDDTTAGPLPDGRTNGLTERLADALRGKRLLLVLDNCEHVIGPAATLADTLLGAASGLHILATSQDPLDVTGELLWRVPPLELPEDAADPETIERSGAVRLFVARAAAASPGFALTAENAEAVAAICRRLDGIPLALELAARRVRVLGVEQLAERLGDRLGLLTGGRRDAPERQRTLRAVIDWSWELLTAAERVVLRRLAVHSDGCTLAATEATCAGDGVKPAEVLDLLARLVDRSLVTVVHGADGPRYRLLESVAVYCAEQLRAAGELDRARRKHAAYYLSLSEEADAHLRGPRQREWLRRMDAETSNVRAALDAAVADGDAALALRLALARVWYWVLRGRLNEAQRSLSLALAASGPEPRAERDGTVRALRARAEAWRAGVRALAGDHSAALPATAARLRAPGLVPEARERAMAGWFLGYVMTKSGNMASGGEVVAEAHDGFRAAGDSWGLAAVLSTRAVQRSVAGELAAARGDAAESLALFREVGDSWGRLQAMAALGRLAEIGGDYTGAARWHEQALAVSEEFGLWAEASVRLSELGRVALLAGDLAGAERLHERGRRLALEQGDTSAEEFAEVGLALTARRQGRLDRAETYLRKWLEWNRRLDGDFGAALILAELGFVAELRGDADAAARLHEEGLTAARRTGDPRAVALAREGLAGARALAGRHVAAARLLGAAAAGRASVGASLPAAESGDVDRITAAVRQALGDAAFRAESARGAAGYAAPEPRTAAV